MNIAPPPQLSSLLRHWHAPLPPEDTELDKSWKSRKKEAHNTLTLVR
jgi:hypothetical protein